MANLFAALDLNRTGTVDVKEFFASLLCTMEPENQVGSLPVSQLELEYLQFLAKQLLVPSPLPLPPFLPLVLPLLLLLCRLRSRDARSASWTASKAGS